MVNAQCPICTDSYPLESFLFLACGHGCCDGCTKNYKGKVCSICRKPKGLVDPHQIYFTVVDDSFEGKVSYSAGKLESLGSLSASSHVASTASNLREMIRDTPLDDSLISRLLQAADNLEERLPIYDQLEAERHSNATLKTRVDELEQDLLISREYCLSVDREHKEILHNYAVSLQESKRLIEHEHTQKELVYQKAKQQKKEMEMEIARLTSLCLEQEKQIKLEKKKSRALARQHTRKRVEEDNDDSLVVTMN
ncbi:uncharacterized protein BT62DRAFT_925636 [Guyanagaster necrorhizus]|uniref:RING-type domain-containing protein n=1 Tax=Guyanagaster necrorhizus TaxID=856835 RepID=A0A9P8AYP0_9AGAR|nr:uncharacterized protein BT62DRAFT_925636 [Guyanagaster necrorhizus MCA 3950]KAG7453094.1 hypothetical protein BT62DRAFT_925636 [Guyanagaster necrorhizus MCA 3950]